MTGQRGRLGGDALHHVAVAAQRVDVVVEELVAGAVEVRRLPLGRDRHADRGRDALTERPGRRLDARRPAVLRMPRAARVDLAEALDVLERDRQLAEPLVGGVDRLHAGEVQQRVEQRRGVADREHEAVAAGPDRVVRVEAQEVLPERVGDGRHRHRRAGMTGVGGLHGVHRERADGGDGELVQRRVGFLRRPAGAGHGVGGHVRHDSTSCDEGVASPAVIGRRGSGVLSRRSLVLAGALLVALPIAPAAEVVSRDAAPRRSRGSRACAACQRQSSRARASARAGA